MPIQVLRPEVAALIAAGEVVQRPASVVKELVDNALDAGATRVHVDIEQGGSRLIRVVDDGWGMSRDDALLCLEKHATSKIADAADLQRILTLGFRGEALAAIGAVGRVEIVTRLREDAVGTRVVAHGTQRAVEDTGCPAGTTVVVRELFARVPARRKFLKTDPTEFRHCSEAVVRAALVNEQVHFTLRHGDRRVLDLPRCESRAERVHALLGRETFDQLYSVAYERGDLLVTGWISTPTLNRNNSAQVYFFVNDRFVQNRTLLSALLESYRNVLPKGRFPVAILYLELDPERVDINVHPSKMEIRFDDESAAFRAVHGAIHHTLTTGGEQVVSVDALSLPPRNEPPAVREASNPLGSPQPARRDAVPHPSAEHTRSILESFLAAPAAILEVAPPGNATMDRAGLADRIRDLDRGPVQQEFLVQAGDRAGGDAGPADNAVPPLQQRLPTGDLASTRGFRPVAYVMGTYLIAESHDRLMIMDTHAAHERIVYERLKQSMGVGGIASQTLLFPIQVELSPRECRLIEQNLERLSELGIVVAAFGDRAYLVSAIPAHVNADDCGRLLHDLLADFEQAGGSDTMTQLHHRLLVTMSCHGAHRSGDHMDHDDMQALLAQYFATPHHETCPHGRPTALVWTREELGRLFKRS